MSILNQYGRIYDRKLVKSSYSRSQSLPWIPNFARDLNELFTEGDQRSTISQARLIFSNFGVPRGAIFQRADGVVGRAWEPEFLGADTEFGEAAMEWLRGWYGICDMRGESFDFKQSMWLNSVALDRDGDVFVQLVKTRSGYPKIQHIAAHRIEREKHLTER